MACHAGIFVLMSNLIVPSNSWAYVSQSFHLLQNFNFLFVFICHSCAFCSLLDEACVLRFICTHIRLTVPVIHNNFTAITHFQADLLRFQACLSLSLPCFLWALFVFVGASSQLNITIEREFERQTDESKNEYAKNGKRQGEATTDWEI